MSSKILKLEMEASIREIIQQFEQTTGLMVTEIRIDKRFDKGENLVVYTKVELRT